MLLITVLLFIVLLARTSARGLNDPAFMLDSKFYSLPETAAPEALRSVKSAVVVLGQALNPDGSPRESLKARVKLAATVVRSMSEGKLGGDVCLVLSGGRPQHTSMSEAEVMKDYILQQHPDLLCPIICEELSRTTIENAVCCKQLFTNECMQHIEYIHVVTSEFHVPRSRCVFECVFGTTSEDDADRKIICHSAPSFLKANLYRAKALRPEKIDDWTLGERLDIEADYLRYYLERSLKEYAINGPSADQITMAMQELCTMNTTTYEIMQE